MFFLSIQLINSIYNFSDHCDFCDL